MEQRYQAVIAVVQDGRKVTELSDRLGVTRRVVHMSTLIERTPRVASVRTLAFP